MWCSNLGLLAGRSSQSINQTKVGANKSDDILAKIAGVGWYKESDMSRETKRWRQNLNPTIFIFKAHRGKQSMSGACITASAVGVVCGIFLHIPDLTTAGGILLVASAATLWVSDAVIVDGRAQVVKRRMGIWPIVSEVSRPFSEIDHIYIEELPFIESDGNEVTLARLSLIRKSGPPILLANTYSGGNGLKARASELSRLLHVETKWSDASSNERLAIA